MAKVKIRKPHKIELDAARTRTLPAGWSGDVDEAVSREIVQAGRGELSGKKAGRRKSAQRQSD